MTTKIIKGLDDQDQVSKYVCLIIKSLDTQAQKLNNEINRYPQKSLILGVKTDDFMSDPGVFGVSKDGIWSFKR